MSIPDDLLAQAKVAAGRQHCSLARLVSDSLRKALASPKSGTRTGVGTLPTFKGNGLQPGVDLDDSAGLLDLMEGR